MGRLIIAEPVPIVEPVFIPDIFATRLARVEKLAGGLIRCVYAADHIALDGSWETVIACRLVRPVEAFSQGMPMLAAVLREEVTEPRLRAARELM